MKRILFLILLSVSLVEVGAQDIRRNSPVKITGMVIDKESGKPIGGADVRIKGERFGVTSSFYGSFSINAMPESVLYVSYPNKETGIVRILRSRTDYHVELEDETDKIYAQVARMPQFPGGGAAFGRFVETHLRFDTLEHNTRVFVEMIIKKDGSFELVKAINGRNEAMNEEALRIMRMMPNWEPGIRRGKPVNVRIRSEIGFPGRKRAVEMIDFWENIDEYDAMNDNGVYAIVNEMPQFPGGMAECTKFISKNLQHKIANRTRKGIVEFVIESDGSISCPQMLRKINPELDSEAIRVIRSMPNWIPGKQDGKPVAVRYILPVMFQPK